jgi:hypothetical protein
MATDVSSPVAQPHLSSLNPPQHITRNPMIRHLANLSLLYSAKGILYSPTSPGPPRTDSSCSKTFLARLCEQAERYDEMVSYMKEVANVCLPCIPLLVCINHKTDSSADGR